MLLRALAVNRTHQLPFFLGAQTMVCRYLFASERCLFPPATFCSMSSKMESVEESMRFSQVELTVD